MNIKLGFSTGTLYKYQGTKDALITLNKAGIKYVELGFVAGLDLDWMRNVSLDDLKEFEYISLHAPKFGYDNNEESLSILREIKIFNDNVRKLNLVIFHPDPIKDFSVLENVGVSIGIENMDNKKETYQTPKELMGIVSNYQNFKIVLDVNHVYTNDPSMDLAAEFYKFLDSKIAEVHLSGYSGYHEALYETKQNKIIQAIKNFNIPIIVESLISPNTVKLEKNYILEQIKVIHEHS